MPRDILSEYGRDSGGPQRPRATSGGVTQARDVMNYSPPQGPTNIMDRKGPGLHGHNCGNSGTQGAYYNDDRQTSGSPGLHGDNRGNRGTQR